MLGSFILSRTLRFSTCIEFSSHFQSGFRVLFYLHLQRLWFQLIIYLISFIMSFNVLLTISYSSSEFFFERKYNQMTKNLGTDHRAWSQVLFYLLLVWLGKDVVILCGFLISKMKIIIVLPCRVILRRWWLYISGGLKTVPGTLLHRWLDCKSV